MITEEILGGYAHKCDSCEAEDGRPTLYWDNRDFDICMDCLSHLYVKFVSQIDKKNEAITVKRKTISETMRRKVFDLYDHKCYECQSTKDLQIDHKIPFSKGGNTEIENLQLLCKSCNFKKRNQIYV